MRAAAQRQLAINSEDSAQGSTARPNRLALASIQLVKRHFASAPNELRVADQGCGRLRHLEALRAEFGRIWLIDKAVQLDREQELLSRRQSIRRFVQPLRGQVTAMDSDEFTRSVLGLDAVFSFCVYDVVTRSVREELARTAAANLREGGLYVVVVPRNDSSILRRCTTENEYEDGYTFSRNGSVTFYANFRDREAVVRPIVRAGLTLIADGSEYRYLGLVFTSGTTGKDAGEVPRAPGLFASLGDDGADQVGG